jgi:2-C-methyl-D-erythritol 4-phosphate cytidylyltransferase
MKITAILTAAGSGSRFSGSSSKTLPKQFLNLNGKPVILYSLMAFQKCRLIDEIFVTAHNSHFDLIHKIVFKNRITKLTILVEGGKTRFESVRNAFHQINAMPGDLVLIHDAVRPNIKRNAVEVLINNAVKYGEVIPGTPINETVKRVKNSIITETVNRNGLWMVQTPQLFRYKVLKKAYEKTAGMEKNFTDEAALVENAGYKVRLIEGKRENIKITSPGDLKLMKKLM